MLNKPCRIIIVLLGNPCGTSLADTGKPPIFESALRQPGRRIFRGIIRPTDTFVRMLFILAVFLLAARTVPADEIVLTTGERFTSSKVWEENGKLRFDMQGLIVSVNLEDVAEVLREGHPPMLRATPPPIAQEPQSPREVPAIPPPQAAPRQPAPVKKPDQSSSRDAQAPGTNRTGIGFDGLAWHMQPNEIPGIKKLKTDAEYGGIDQYWRPDGNLTWGKAALDGLIFGFWRNRLYSIMIWVNGKPGYERLQQAAFQYYGKGRKNPQGLERYVWLDETTDRMLEFDPQLNTGIFWMRSRDLDQQIKKLYPE